MIILYYQMQVKHKSKIWIKKVPIASVSNYYEGRGSASYHMGQGSINFSKNASF